MQTLGLADDRYNASPKGQARAARFRASGKHALNQRRYYLRGGQHTISARRVQQRIDRMTQELEDLNGQR